MTAHWIAGSTTLLATRVDGLPSPLSKLVLGTMTFGDTVGPDEAASMVGAAIDAGITVIDTANTYAGGASEEILGTILKRHRDSVMIATKAGMPHADHGDHPPLSARGLLPSIHASLRRLGVDRIDLFYLHQPDRATPIEETMQVIAELMRQGTIGALGVSNFSAWQIGEIDHVADRLGMPRPVVAQQLYNLLARRIEEEYLEFARTTGLRTMVYNPLGGGLLTGKYDFAEVPSTGRFGESRLASVYQNRYWDPRLFEAITRLTAIADGAGMTLIELSLRWLISSPGVDAILIGASQAEQLRANVRAASQGALPADLLAACDDIARELRGPMPAYNR